MVTQSRLQWEEIYISISPSLPSTPRNVPSRYETKSLILYLHSPGVRPKVIVRSSGRPQIQDSLSRQGGDVYGSKSKGRKEGIDAGAHISSFGGLSELGEASERAHDRRRSRWPEVEEDGGEGVRGRLASLGLARRSRTR